MDNPIYKFLSNRSIGSVHKLEWDLKSELRIIKETDLDCKHNMKNKLEEAFQVDIQDNCFIYLHFYQTHRLTSTYNLFFWTTTHNNLNGVIDLDEFDGESCIFYLKHDVLWTISEYHRKNNITPPKFYLLIHEDVNKITESAEFQHFLSHTPRYCQIKNFKNSVSSNKTIRLFVDTFETMYKVCNLEDNNFDDFDIDSLRSCWKISCEKVIENHLDTIKEFQKTYEHCYSLGK